MHICIGEFLYSVWYKSKTIFGIFQNLILATIDILKKSFVSVMKIEQILNCSIFRSQGPCYTMLPIK